MAYTYFLKKQRNKEKDLGCYIVVHIYTNWDPIEALVYLPLVVPISWRSKTSCSRIGIFLDHCVIFLKNKSACAKSTSYWPWAPKLKVNDLYSSQFICICTRLSLFHGTDHSFDELCSLNRCNTVYHKYSRYRNCSVGFTACECKVIVTNS